MRKRFWKGLRAIDLILAAFIICTILSVVLLRYDDFKCRAMESEAKFSLQEVYAAQMRFHREHNHFAPVDKLIIDEERVVLPQRYYILSDGIPPSKDVFSVLATGVLGTLVAREQWSVNEDNEIRLVNAVCKNN